MILKVDKRSTARVARGYPWVYANEAKADLKKLAPGELVTIADERGGDVAFGFANPRSLILARVLSREPVTFDAAFFEARLRAADARRARWRPGESSYRLCYGESDDLPGLVIDRFGDVCVVQSHAAGIDALTPSIVEGLVRAVAPKGVLLKYDSSSRVLEGLANRVEVAHGEVPEIVEAEIEGARFALDLRAGQKTGFFHDQAPNRALFAPWCAGKRVLDVFCYVGAWSIAAAKAGAAEVTGVDSSADAIAWAARNAERNGLTNTRFEKADAFEDLKRREGEQWDTVVLDPPAFVKSRKKLDEGMRGYREINRRGFALVKPGGILATSSCSRNVPREAFVGMLMAAADDARRTARIVAFGRQGPDHPIHLKLPETEYLKCVFLQVD